MPVTLTIVESTTVLGIETTEVNLVSASEPGPAGVGVPAGGTDGQVLTKTSATDYETAWEDPTGGGGGASAAEDVTFTPAGGIASTDVQAALEELDTEKAAASHAHAGEDITSGTVADARIASTIARDSEVTAAVAALSTVYQPLDADLTAVAALTTTAFGRGLLELANQAALLSAAGAAAASHAHAGEDITSGTVADARIAATIARDSEVTAAIAALSTVYQPLDSDLTAIAALTTTAFGRSLLAMADAAAVRAALDLEAGTDFPSLTTFNDHSARHENGGADEISLAGLDGIPAELQTHLDDTADAHDASAVSFTPAGSIAATDVQAAIEEVAAEAGGSGEADKLTLEVAQTAHGLAAGEWIRLDASGDYVLAQADSAANAEVVGIVIAVADANNFTVQRNGYVEAGLSGLTAGDVYFLDVTTPGAMTDTEPTTLGEVSKPLLVAESATSGWMSAEMRGVIVPGEGDPPAASEVSVDSTDLSGTATNVQDSLEELDNLLDDHSARHENGGADEISVAGLSGELADAQPTNAAHVDAEASTDGQVLTSDGAGNAAWEDPPAGGAVAAEDVSIADAGNDFTATDVEGALAELQADHEADATALSTHIADPTAAHAASAVSADSTTLVGTGTDVQAVLEELDNAIADHLADTDDAHDASAISIADAGGDFTATTVEGALDELQADAEADAQALADHIADGAGAHAASAVSVNSTTLSGTGTDVQASLEEIDNLLDDHSARHENGGADEISIAGLDGTPTELTNHLNDGADAHDASAISVADSGGHFDATEVEAALTELAVAARTGRLYLSAAGMWPSTTSGAAENTKTEYGTNDVDMYGLAFDQTAQEFAQATVAMPSDWDGGTVTAQFYWTKTGTGTDGVVWGCQGRSYGDNEAIDQAFGTAQEVTDAGQSATDVTHVSSATAAITLAGTPAAGELVQFRVYRDPADGADALATDAILLGVMIAYNRNI